MTAKINDLLEIAVRYKNTGKMAEARVCAYSLAKKFPDEPRIWWLLLSLDTTDSNAAQKLSTLYVPHALDSRSRPIFTNSETLRFRRASIFRRYKWPIIFVVLVVLLAILTSLNLVQWSVIITLFSWLIVIYFALSLVNYFEIKHWNSKVSNINNQVYSARLEYWRLLAEVNQIREENELGHGIELPIVKKTNKCIDKNLISIHDELFRLSEIERGFKTVPLEETSLTPKSILHLDKILAYLSIKILQSKLNQHIHIFLRANKLFNIINECYPDELTIYGSGSSSEDGDFQIVAMQKKA